MKFALLLLVLLSGCPWRNPLNPFGSWAYGQTLCYGRGTDLDGQSHCCDPTGCSIRVPTDFTYAELLWARPIIKACGVQGLDGTSTPISPYIRVTLRGTTSAMECLRSKGVQPLGVKW